MVPSTKLALHVLFERKDRSRSSEHALSDALHMVFLGMSLVEGCSGSAGDDVVKAHVS